MKRERRQRFEAAIATAAMRRFDSWRTAPAKEYLHYDPPDGHKHASALVRACALFKVAK